MKTAIVYASKHGATAEIAQRLALKLGSQASLFDLAAGQPDLSDYDTVILGSGIYAGRKVAQMNEFLETVDLSKKRLGLFISGMLQATDQRQAELQAAYPAELIDQAQASAFLGGRVVMSKLGFAERSIIRLVAKIKSDIDTIDNQAIDEFVEQMSE
ncbi:MAG: flavodoxin domain-containing protein [Coriobacteriales bacterium]|nr:flavodoxin domain-containing protein [Coriobacteriales bacterium]